MKNKITVMKLIVWGLLAGLVICILLFYKSVFWMLIGSVIFSYLLKPAVEFLEGYKLARWIAILLIYLVLAGLLVLGLMIIVPVFINQVHDIGGKVTEIASTSGSIAEFKITEVEMVKKIFSPIIEFSEKTGLYDLNKLFQDFLYSLKNMATNMPQGISSFAGKLFNIFTFLFMVPSIGFFMLLDHEKFRKVLFSGIPNRFFELTVIIIEKTDYVLKTFFRAMMLEMLIVAAMSTVALVIVGVPYSIVIGLIAGVANVIPYLGPWIGILAAIISIFLSGEPLMMIISAIVALQIVQILENKIVYPYVMGRSMEMHPLVILLTVLAGGYSFGFIGMLFAVPIVFLVKEIVTILVVNLHKFEII
ncbi:MAG: AI-2E family transporter [Candidatus Cloacimonetes bacterium]|nr:AI-2E family transporter [Candidatus Cloacimonadota bacterium]